MKRLGLGDMDLEKDANKQESHALERHEVIEVPDGGYGWFVMIGCWFLNFATWGANAGYSVYLANYLQHNKFKGANKLDYAAIGGLAFGTGMLLGPLIRRSVQLVGVRPTVGIGAVLQFLGTMLAAFSVKRWEIYCSQGLLIGLGLGINFIPSVSVLPPWFRERRALAQSIAVGGSGMGGIVFNLGVEAMIRNLSLRWALIIQAIMCAFCNVVGVALIRERGKSAQLAATVWDNRMLVDPVFIMFVLYLCTALLGYVCLLYSLSDFTISLGYTENRSAIVSSMISLGNFVGRPVVGRIADRTGPVSTSIVCHTMVAIFCFAMWIPARNFATAVAFALIQGGLMGTIWVVISSIAARVVGLRKMNVVLSMTWVFMGMFGIVSPLISIQLRGNSTNGSDPSQYRNPAIYCGCCYAASVFILMIIRGYLVSRDKAAVKRGSHQDSEESDIEVSLLETLKGMLEISEIRKV